MTTNFDHIPRHIAIIMDGNGRWAQQRGSLRAAGHRAGAHAVQRIVAACRKQNIEVLTLFAFSSENWRRPRQEVNLLMELFVNTLRSEVQKLHDNDIRLRFIGDRSAFSQLLRDHLERAEVLTAANRGMTLVVAANYGGRWDIWQAAQKLVEHAQQHNLPAADLSNDDFVRGLSLYNLPEPDLLIRTGGERRISNFLLWDFAYTELYFSDQYWPDYDEQSLHQALHEFSQRQRRYGKTAEQVSLSY